MKSFAMASALLLFLAATASAGDLAVSESTLKGMGLAGMQQLSDEDGLAVRGMGLFDNLGLGGFGGGFGMPDVFGDAGIPAQFQLGNAFGIILNDEIGLGDLGLPADVGFSGFSGFGGFGGFGL
jgi:hypothetical protein